MTPSKALSALIVTADAALARQAVAALAHPGLALHAPTHEQAIVAALKGDVFALVVVGGNVGCRGPLVLCDAVRLRQSTASIVVLVRAETGDAALADHAARHLPGVHYVDLRRTANAHEQAAKLRAAALLATGLAEDDAAQTRWPQLLREARERLEPEPPGACVDDADVIEVPAQLTPVDNQVTDADREFAARMVARTRGVDFRAAAPPSCGGGAASPTVRLRERARELERQLARLSHVYGTTLGEMASAAARHRAALTERETMLAQLSGLRAQVSEERERWRDEAKGKDKIFGQLLTHSQQTFAGLRESSSVTASHVETRLSQLERERQGCMDEVSRARQGEQAAVARLCALAVELKDALLAAGERSALKTQLADLQAALDGSRRHEGELSAQLASVRLELAAMSNRRGDEAAAAERQARELVDAKQAALAALSRATRALREALERRTARLGERELRPRSVAEPLRRAAEVERAVGGELDKARARAGAVDAGLLALATMVRSGADDGVGDVAAIAGQEELARRATAPLALALAHHTAAGRAISARWRERALAVSTVAPRVLSRRSAGVLALGALVAVTLHYSLLGATGTGHPPQPLELRVPARASALSAGGDEPELSAVIAESDGGDDFPGIAKAVCRSHAAPPRLPAASSAPVPIEVRKQLRRALFEAIKGERWHDAAEYGLALRAGAAIDWEAQLGLADALRRAGRSREAVLAYRAFVEEERDNKFLERARSALAELTASRHDPAIEE